MTFSKVSISIPKPTLQRAFAKVRKKKALRGNRYGLSTYITELLQRDNHIKV